MKFTSNTAKGEEESRLIVTLGEQRWFQSLFQKSEIWPNLAEIFSPEITNLNEAKLCNNNKMSDVGPCESLVHM